MNDWNVDLLYLSSVFIVPCGGLGAGRCADVFLCGFGEISDIMTFCLTSLQTETSWTFALGNRWPSVATARQRHELQIASVTAEGNTNQVKETFPQTYGYISATQAWRSWRTIYIFLIFIQFSSKHQPSLLSLGCILKQKYNSLSHHLLLFSEQRELCIHVQYLYLERWSLCFSHVTVWKSLNPMKLVR